MTRTVCGTPEYIAPEIILRQGHGHAADWWSLGCIVYEMLVGIPPFYVEDRREVYKRIVSSKVKFTNNVNPVAIDLISKLLDKTPSQRLGASGGEEIMRHPWFYDVNWDDIYNKTVQPPFVPDINCPLDSSFFDEGFTKSSIGESPNMESSPVCSLTYKGFSYTGSLDSQVMEIE